MNAHGFLPSRLIRITLVAAACLAIAGCSSSHVGDVTGAPGANASGAPPVTGLTITSPGDAEIVATSLVIVEGTAPAGVTITRDIHLARDSHSTADAAGNWKMPVYLKPGDNVLVFRIGNDKSTAVTLHVVLDSAAVKPTAGPTEAPIASGAAIGLGTRPDIAEKLSDASGYEWRQSPMSDGRIRTIADSADGTATCAIVGPSASVTEVGILFTIEDTAGRGHARAMLGILIDRGQLADVESWAFELVDNAAAHGDETTRFRVFGTRQVVVMTGYIESGGLAAIFSVTPV
jgi:hypothetical protein